MQIQVMVYICCFILYTDVRILEPGTVGPQIQVLVYICFIILYIDDSTQIQVLVYICFIILYIDDSFFGYLERLERNFKQWFKDGFSIFKHSKILKLGTVGT